MDIEEARAWLAGERSMTNNMHGVEGATVTGDLDRQTTLVRIEQADAAATERAYWVLRAHRDGLL